MNFKKLLILCILIMLFPSFCYAEGEKEYNLKLSEVSDGEDKTDEDENSSQKEENDTKKEYVYFFKDKSLVRFFCANPGDCDYSNDGFALTSPSNGKELRNFLDGKTCDGKDCYSYMKENYCNNWKSKDKACEALEAVETLENNSGNIANVNGFTCGGTDILKVLKFVSILVDLILFIVPMGLIAILMFDLMKNVMAGKEDEMKKNVSIAIKRMGFAAMLFLLPHIVGFMVSFLGSVDIPVVKYAGCIDIAKKDEDLWKYKIVWDHYPYDGVEDTYMFGTLSENGRRYVEYKSADGSTITIWDDETVEVNGEKVE